jgi:hypothetical protein
MKISLLIAAIIVGLAALFGFQQREKIKRLTTEWEELKTTAVAKNISTDPDATFSSQRVRSDSARAAREKAINDFAAELAAFAQKMETAERDGNSRDAEMQKEVMGFIEKLTSMSPADLKSLVKALSADTSIKDESKRQLIMMSIMMLSSENPEAALAIISESSDSLGLDGRSDHMLPMVLSQYANKDPQGAAAWLMENEDTLGEKATQTKKHLVAATAQNDFNSAMAMIDTLGLQDDKEVYGKLANGVKAGDQDAFLKALQDNKVTTEQRDAALGSLATSPFIKDDFKTASAWLDNPELSPSDKESIVQNLHYHSVKNAAGEWLGWICQQENKNQATERATQQILRGWTQDNFVAAGEWIQTQENGPGKNTAVKTYAETLAPHEPAAAADWATTLPEGTERSNLLQTIHLSLKGKDPAAAQALAEKHGLQVESPE